jgi:hypothetical protein
MTPSKPAPRSTLVVANLHAEMQWAGHGTTSAALKYAAAAGTLMRVLAGPTDPLWLPAAIDPARLVEHERLPRPPLVTGSFDAIRGYHAVTAWAETQDVARLRAKRGFPVPVRWDVAARANHRGFFLEVAERAGLAHPGTAFVTSIDALKRHVAKAGLRTFVAKEPLSAAGRGKFVLCPDELDDAIKAKALGGRIAACGGMLIEPWVTRSFDFGVACETTPTGGARVIGLHRQLVDERGKFQGLRLRTFESEPEWLDDRGRERVTIAVDVVASALVRLGYGGPFTLDGYGVRGDDGSERVHALGEINARYTMGRLAHELGARMGWEREFELRVGDGEGCEVVLLEKGEEGVGMGVRFDGSK